MNKVEGYCTVLMLINSYHVIRTRSPGFIGKFHHLIGCLDQFIRVEGMGVEVCKLLLCCSSSSYYYYYYYYYNKLGRHLLKKDV